MLKNANLPIEEAFQILGAAQVEAGFISPRSTGLGKSIMDAHAELRRFLVLNGIHDYDNQPQGSAHKAIIPTELWYQGNWVKAHASLYRPKTKTGDPRIWFRGLRGKVNVDDLLAIVPTRRGEFLLVDMSDTATQADLRQSNSLLYQTLLGAQLNSVATQLETLLRSIAASGPHPARLSGPTAVGSTLEHLLGLPPTSKGGQPDYHGIEIKTSTQAPGKKASMETLFGMKPEWGFSEYDALRALNTFHSPGGAKLYLDYAVRAHSRQGGFTLEVSPECERLDVLNNRNTGTDERVSAWGLLGLERRLAMKHKETFWVKAKKIVTRSGTQFDYRTVYHTRGVFTQNFVQLLGAGTIEVHLNTSESTTLAGDPNVRDHGYLFRIAGSNWRLLFPPPRIVRLR